MTRYVLGVYCLCAGHTLAAASGDNGPVRHLPSALAPSLRYDADHEAADVPRSRAATLLLDPAAIDGVESVVLRCDWLSSIGLEVYANRREKRCDDRAALLDQVTNQPRAADVFVDCGRGSDARDGSSRASAVASLGRAQSLVRALRRAGAPANAAASATVVEVSGECRLNQPWAVESFRVFDAAYALI
jgi:hypothetical protein